MTINPAHVKLAGVALASKAEISGSLNVNPTNCVRANCVEKILDERRHSPTRSDDFEVGEVSKHKFFIFVI